MGLNRRANGWLCITGADGSVDEAATFTCAHCQRITRCSGKGASDLGGFCRQCDALICAKCVGRDCVPFLKRIEAAEESAYRRRQLEQALGL